MSKPGFDDVEQSAQNRLVRRQKGCRCHWSSEASGGIVLYGRFSTWSYHRAQSLFESVQPLRDVGEIILARKHYNHG